MSIYFLRLKKIARGKGMTATAAAAYISASQIDDARLGMSFSYRSKRGVVHSEIMAPVGCEWALDRGALWNRAEQEKHPRATVAREIIVAIPHEISEPRRLALVRAFARELSQKHGVAVDTNIHAPNQRGDDRNFHAHLQFTTRRVTPEGLGEKTREWDDLKLGPKEMEFWRTRWAALVNSEHIRAFQPERVDSRSYDRQGKDLVGQVHLGVATSGRERRGFRTPRGDYNRKVREINMAINKGCKEQTRLQKLIEQLEEDARAGMLGGDEIPEEAREWDVSFLRGSKHRPMLCTIESGEEGDGKVYEDLLRHNAYKVMLMKLIYPDVGIVSIGYSEGFLKVLFRGDGEVFDYGSRVVAKAGSDLEVSVMLKLARLKRWRRISLTGGKEFRRKAWKAAIVEAGYHVDEIDGYEPEEKDLEYICNWQEGTEGKGHMPQATGHLASSERVRVPAANDDANPKPKRAKVPR